MDRIEIIAGAVHQVLVATGAIPLPDWLNATERQQSAIYHILRFWETLDPNRFSITELRHASEVAWNNYAVRAGWSEGTRLPPSVFARMVDTYLVLRHLLGEPQFRN